ncbi:MAG: BON domain-containing protein, partial [Betaproteobacteria bacterium]|nr:BON domain-containing protein [Betaproteobacteria bacterium]
TEFVHDQKVLCARAWPQRMAGKQVQIGIRNACADMAEAFNEPTLKSAEISVETFKGAVQLSGFVSEPGNIIRAAELARSVKGVTIVKTDMHLK